MDASKYDTDDAKSMRSGRSSKKDSAPVIPNVANGDKVTPLGFVSAKAALTTQYAEFEKALSGKQSPSARILELVKKLTPSQKEQGGQSETTDELIAAQNTLLASVRNLHQPIYVLFQV